MCAAVAQRSAGAIWFYRFIARASLVFDFPLHKFTFSLTFDFCKEFLSELHSITCLNLNQSKF